MEIEIAGAVLVEVDHGQLLRLGDRADVCPAPGLRGLADDPVRRQRGGDPIGQGGIGGCEIKADTPDPVRSEVAFQRNCMGFAGMGGGIGRAAEHANFL